MTDPNYPARATIDLTAIRDNTRRIAEATDVHVMAVLKSNGYGHGLIPSAKAALAGGATFLGVSHVADALRLRAEGIAAPVLAWLHSPTVDFDAAIADDIEIGVSDLVGLKKCAKAHAHTGACAKVQLKIDTGLGRNGIGRDDLPRVLEHARAFADQQRIQVTGVFSHYAFADAPDHPVLAEQDEAFTAAVEQVRAAGFDPQWTHISHSAAVLAGRAADQPWSLVRPGLALYGISPIPSSVTAEAFGLRPALRLTARLATVKRIEAGSGISLGHRHTAEKDGNIGILPLGFADGIPRQVTDGLPVLVGGESTRTVGQICMDQSVIDLGARAVEPGEEVVLLGDPAKGEPGVQDWADAAGTVPYEIVTRLSAGIPRKYVTA